MEPPELDRMKFNFSQQANCFSKQDEYEFLEIKCLSDIGIDGGGGFFMVLKTKQWSIDSLDDLQKLVDRIKQVMNNNNTKQYNTNE